MAGPRRRIRAVLIPLAIVITVCGLLASGEAKPPQQRWANTELQRTPKDGEFWRRAAELQGVRSTQ